MNRKPGKTETVHKTSTVRRTSTVRQNVLPVLAALIWGTAFVAQSVGAETVGPFFFTAARSVIAFVFLLGVCAARRKLAGDTVPPSPRKPLLKGGLLCGTALAVATCFQQKGLETTPSGKAGFLTALYIILVPILGMFLGRKTPLTVWCGLPIAAAGLYLLCASGPLTIEPGDGYVLLCSLCFSCHILLVDRFSVQVDGMELSCAQFLTETVLCTLWGVLFREPFSMGAVLACAGPVLYLGVFSSGVAYTLQILSQRDADPTVVSLLLSLESVFATLAGAVLLHERLTGREYLGCALLLAAVVLAQLPPPRKMGCFSGKRVL